jgi:hypothetical protein
VTAVNLAIVAAADPAADPADPTAARLSVCAPSSAEGTDRASSRRRPGPVLALADADARVLRLSDAGDDRSAWVTMLTTEHYALQGMRSAAIGEANGRASIFLGAVSAGLIALGFQGGGRSPATTAFQVLVLSGLGLLGVVTFLRCLQISIDDGQFSLRINRLRAVYAQLVPDLAGLLAVAAGAEQSTAMLTRRRQPFQAMLTVAGTIGIVTTLVLGADVGVLVYGPTGHLGAALLGGAAAGLAVVVRVYRFQLARWRGVSWDPGN